MPNKRRRASAGFGASVHCNNALRAVLNVIDDDKKYALGSAATS